MKENTIRFGFLIVMAILFLSPLRNVDNHYDFGLPINHELEYSEDIQANPIPMNGIIQKPDLDRVKVQPGKFIVPIPTPPGYEERIL